MEKPEKISSKKALMAQNLKDDTFVNGKDEVRKLLDLGDDDINIKGTEDIKKVI